jgi:transposase
MNHRTGLDRSQTLLFPERLEDYIAAENPARFLDAFVASLDLRALGFARARCAPTGCPPYNPSALLKLYLYGYLHRVRSSRMLEAECHRNVEVLWLLGKLAPDFKTIADFRKDNLQPLKAVARQFTQARANLELKQAEVVADAGCYNAAEVSRCVEQNLTPYIPKADTSANTARGLYGKSRFKYDAVKDVYVCPAGAELNYRFSTYELGRELKYYRARGCNQCALKKQCTRNKANRTITREANEHLMEAMAQRMKAQPGKFKLRKTLAEHPFGTIKRWFGYTHFLLKGLAKVQCEWSLTTLAYNLKRVLNLVSFGKLMAAVGVQVPQSA